MPIAIRVCILALLLVMAASSMAAVEDDWSVLTEAEIASLLPSDHDAGLTGGRPWYLWLLLAWGAAGFVALGWFLVRTLRHAERFRKRMEPPAPYRRWTWLLLTPLLILLILPLPWTSGVLWHEAAIEGRTWWLYLYGRPILLQGTVRHVDSGEPVSGVWLRYRLQPTYRHGPLESPYHYDLVLRSDGDGRWRVELPARSFARYMAEQGDTDPQPHAFAPGMREHTLGAFTQDQQDRIFRDPARGLERIRDQLRAEKGDTRIWMGEEPERQARLLTPSRMATACGVDIARWAGPEVQRAGPMQELCEAVRAERREVVCLGREDGQPFDLHAVHSLTLFLHQDPERRHWAQKRLAGAGVEQGTLEYERAICQILTEWDR